MPHAARAGRHARTLGTFVVLVVLLSALIPRRAARGGEGDAAPGAAPDAYVGSEVCENCHQEEVLLWQASSHAHTFERADATNLPGDVLAGVRVTHAPGSTQFRAKDGRYAAETVGPDGTPTHYPLTHVVGRMRVQMYVATLPDGRQQVLPAMLEVPTDGWFDYTQLIFGAGGTDWDKAPLVAPGDPSSWSGPVRSWDARCARCHVSGWAWRRPAPDGHGPRYRMRRLGVDCESCHGPAAAHVEFRESKLEGQDPMVAFRSLGHRQALSMCLQCHMESEVVSEDFKLGEDIFEYRDPTLLLDPERIDPSGRPLELIYDGTPISVSRCVAEGKLTCATCHDPHGSSQPSQLRTDPATDALCTTCHEELAKDIAAHTHHTPKGPGSRCVACHMPFLQIERKHGVIADHSINIPRFDLKADRVAKNACQTCHDGGVLAPAAAPKLDATALGKAHRAWYGARAAAKPWMQALGAARLGAKGAALGLVRILEDRKHPRLVRASAVALLGRYAQEAPLALLAYARDEDSLVRRSAVAGLAGLHGTVVDEALLRAVRDPSRAVRRAAARAALEGWTRVQHNAVLLGVILPVLTRDAEEGPEDDLRWFRLGAARSIAGDDAGALAAYERQVELDPFAENTRKEVARLRKQLQVTGKK